MQWSGYNSYFQWLEQCYIIRSSTIECHSFRSCKSVKLKKPTSGPRSLDLNLDTKSCVVTGATARRTVLISSSVTGDTLTLALALFEEAAAFDVGFEEAGAGASSLMPDVLVSYAKKNHFNTDLEKSIHVHGKLRFGFLQMRSKQSLLTDSTFTFFEAVPPDVFASSPPDFLFCLDFDAGGVLRACPDEGVGLAGLLSTGSSFG